MPARFASLSVTKYVYVSRKITDLCESSYIAIPTSAEMQRWALQAVYHAAPHGTRALPAIRSDTSASRSSITHAPSSTQGANAPFMLLKPFKKEPVITVGDAVPTIGALHRRSFMSASPGANEYGVEMENAQVVGAHVNVQTSAEAQSSVLLQTRGPHRARTGCGLYHICVPPDKSQGLPARWFPRCCCFLALTAYSTS